MRIFVFILLVTFLTSCASVFAQGDSCPAVLEDGDYCAYDASRLAQDDVEQAQAYAAENGLKTIIVMGANWCHDSRALAGHFQTPKFQTLFKDHYSVVYVDVGQKNRNLDIARSFGLDGIVGTPTIIVTDTEGKVLNLDTAPTWRNAASRSEDDIYTYFEGFSTQ